MSRFGFASRNDEIPKSVVQVKKRLQVEESLRNIAIAIEETKESLTNNLIFVMNIEYDE
jgi:hypothetical protein